MQRSLRRAPQVYRPQSVTHDAAAGYHLGLTTIQWLRHYFPDVWTRHLADTLLTPGRLERACEAFLLLVDHEMFPLVDEFVGQWFDLPGRTVEQALAEPLLPDQEALLALIDAAPALRQPWPRCYGLGIASLLDDDVPVDLLTLALWHICERCPWNLGIDLDAYTEQLGLSTGKLRFLRALPQISGFVGRLDELIALLNVVQPEPPLGTLVAYAFGCTHNPLANTATDEIWTVHQGTTDLIWEAADSYRAIALEARQIEGDYLRLSRRATTNPNMLRTLADRLCGWRHLLTPG